MLKNVGTNAVVALLAASTASIAVAEIVLTRATIDGGGTMHSASGVYDLSGTTGQSDAGTMTSEQSGSEITLHGGFWFPVPIADCEDDGDVDLMDHRGFELCLQGPDRAAPSNCACFDVDRNHVIDLRDFAAAQAAFTGG